ncbi:TPA: hypothetical protein RQK14_004195 [Vibrio vulnificus]|nr:hypothetical protein [Vibrio vulnificus]
MASSNFISLVIGIVSSLMATALFIGLSEFVRKVVIPWGKDKLYNGVRIDGDWIHDIEKSKYKFEAQMSLSQWGNQVEGSYHHKVSNRQENYKVSGTVSNQFVLLNFTPISDKRMDVAVSLLHIDEADDHGKLELVGKMLNKSGSSKVNVIEHLVFKHDS